MSIRILLSLIALLAFTQFAQASREGQLPFGEFSITSPGIGSSGPITVRGVAAQQGITELNIEAFGKRVVLSPQDLTQLRSVQPNGIQLSYEGGYRELGGRTLYIQFSRGFTSGLVSKVLIALNEEGKINITQGGYK